jgi:hypothetical protein
VAFISRPIVLVAFFRFKNRRLQDSEIRNDPLFRSGASISRATRVGNVDQCQTAKCSPEVKSL